MKFSTLAKRGLHIGDEDQTKICMTFEQFCEVTEKKIEIEKLYNKMYTSIILSAIASVLSVLGILQVIIFHRG